MLTERQAFKGLGEPAMAAVEVTKPPRESMGRYATGPAQFLAIVVQFGLIVLVVHQWRLESVTLSRVMQLAFVGFIIHHLLPLRFRLPFFAALSLVAVITGVGQIGPVVIAGWIHGKSTLNGVLYQLVPGLTLIGVGLGLMGLCHLPIRFAARVGLVAVAGAGLVFLRAHSQWFPDLKEMW